MRALLPALLLFLAAPAAAADNWNGEASLTGSKTTGNTDTLDIGAALRLREQDGVWRHKFRLSADYGEARSTQNKERFRVGHQVERTVSDRLFVFGDLNGFYDGFGPFREGYFVGGGLGYTVLEDEPTTWDLTGGIGYRSQKASDDTTQEEVALRLASDFDWTINDKVAVNMDSEALIADSDDYLWNEIGLTSTLMGSLAARASFRVDYHSEVPEGRVSTDTITRFGLVYTID